MPAGSENGAEKRIRHSSGVFVFLVPGVGFEPTNPFESRILNPLRKPFRHPGIILSTLRRR